MADLEAGGADPGQTSAATEKQRVALSSLLAAVLLTGLKLVVGVLTNSLGILSEAAHSGLDLVAAGVTYMAIRVSDRPPDSDHTYGHGKVENLSALIETMLLLGACVWIVYEAVHRLIQPVAIQPSVWGILVMAASIAIDLTRSRALLKMAKKHSSQALEADALHFSTDVWSASVVIAGLLAVWWGRHIGSPWLYRADAVAALGVSAIIVYVGIRLGRRTVDVLLDRTSREMARRVEDAVRSVPGILGVGRVRLRHSGPSTFVDMTLDVPRSASFEEAHALATEAERAVQRLVPRTDVMVHIDPAVKDEDSLVELVNSAAARHGLSVHGLRAYDVRGRLSLTMHVEVVEDMTVGQAHERVSSFEATLFRELPSLGEVTTHIEPAGDAEVRRNAVRERPEEVVRAVKDLPRTKPEVSDCHNIRIHREDGGLAVSFHCLVSPDLPIREAHQITVDLEAILRAQLSGLGRIVIHLEPPEARDG